MDVKNQIAKAFGLIFLLIFSLFAVSQIAYADDDMMLEVTKTPSVTTILPGQQFHYDIDYNAISITENFHNVVIRDEFDNNLEYVSVAPNIHVKQNGINYFYDNAISKYVLEVSLVNSGSDELLAGTSGRLEVNVRVKNGSSPAGTQISNTANISHTVTLPDNTTKIVTFSSAPAVVTTTGSQSKWIVSKQQTRESLLQDGSNNTYYEITYRISLLENYSSPYGRLNLNNVQVIDNIPNGVADADVSFTGNGVYDPINHIVTWTLSEATIDNQYDFYITLRYRNDNFKVDSLPEGTPDNRAVVAVNKATGLGTPIGDVTPVALNVAQVNTAFQGPKPPVGGNSIKFKKTARYSYRYAGQEQVFTISGITNPGNIPLENYVVTDDALPFALVYTTIKLPVSDTVQPYTFYFKTDVSGYSVYVIPDGATSINISDFVPVGEALTGIRFDFGTLPSGYEASNIEIRGNARNVADYPQLDYNVPYENTADLDYSYTVAPDPTPVLNHITGKAGFSLNSPKPWIKPTKTITTGDIYIPRNNVGFRLSIANKADATGNYVSPIVYDLLPVDFSYVEGSFTTSLSGHSIDFQVLTTDYKGTGRTLLKWQFSDVVLNPGQSFIIDYNANIKANTLPTITNIREYLNDVYITTELGSDGVTPINDTGFWWDIENGKDASDYVPSELGHSFSVDKASIITPSWFGNDNGFIPDSLYLVKATGRVYVNDVAAVKIQKYNKGDLDTEFHMYPQYGSAVPGGSADYKLVLTNDGNIGIKSLDLIDIFPFTGDTAILNSQSRLSQWGPNLISTISTANFKKYTADGQEIPFDGSLAVKYSKTSNKAYINFSTDLSDTRYWLPNDPSTFEITDIKSIYMTLSQGGAELLAPGQYFVVTWKMRAPLGAPVNQVAWNSIALKANLMDNSSLLPTEPIKVGFKVNSNPKGAIGNYVWYDSNNDGIQNDGYDAQNAGINGIVVILKDGSGNELDRTITGNDQNGNPGYYLFPNLNAGNYQVEFVLPAEGYYKQTLTDANANSLDSSDSDGLLVNVTLGDSEINDSIDLGLTANNPLKPADVTIDKKAVRYKNLSGNTDDFNPDATALHIGETVYYEYSVTNNGSVPLHNIKFTDIIGNSNLKFTKALFNNTLPYNPIETDENLKIYEEDGNDVVLSKLLMPNETYVFYSEYKLSSSDLPNQEQRQSNAWRFENKFKVIANEIPLEKQVAEDIDIAELVITKTANVTKAEVGDTINYTITVQNLGNKKLTNVTVSDPMLTNLTPVSSGFDLESDETKTFTGTYVLKDSDLKNPNSTYHHHALNNTATVTANEIRKQISAFASVQTLSYAVTKYTRGINKLGATVNKDEFGQGETITYLISVVNNGSAALTNVTVTSDSLLSLSHQTPLQSLANGLSIANINPNQTKTLTYTYVIPAADIAAAGSVTPKITNTVTVKPDNMNESKTATHSDDLIAFDFVKEITNPENEPYRAGDTIFYKITVTNRSSKAVTGVTITDTLTVFDSNNSSSIVENFALGETKTFTLKYVVKASDLRNAPGNTGIVTNNASLSYTYLKLPINSTVSSNTKGIKVEKTNDGPTGTLKVNDIIHYTVKITNIGSVLALNVNIDDAKIGLTDYLAVASLASGETFTKVFDYSVTQTDVDSISPIANTVHVDDKQSPTDDRYVEATASATFLNPAIRVNKYVVIGDNIPANYKEKWATDSPGEPLIYIFEIENVGSTYLKEIELNDPSINITLSDTTFEASLSNAVYYGSSILAPGEKYVFSYHTVITDDLINTVSVKAKPVDASGNQLPNKDQYVTDDDTATVDTLPSIGDMVFNDVNKNGILDAGETGVSGVVVHLYDSNNNLLGTKITDVNGHYIFKKLQPGDYYVIFYLRPDLSNHFTFTTQGTEDFTDNNSDANPVTGRTPIIHLTKLKNLTIDAGVYEYNSYYPPAGPCNNPQISFGDPLNPKYQASNYTLYKFAGNGIGGFNGEKDSKTPSVFNPATTSNLYGPRGIAIDKYGSVYIADEMNGAIRKVAIDGSISTITGTGRENQYTPANFQGPAYGTGMYEPMDMIAAPCGKNLYFVETDHHIVRMIDENGNLNTIAGMLELLSAGQYSDGDRNALKARFKTPQGIAVDLSGNVYVADTYNNVIRRIGNNGSITTIAGQPVVAGFSGDGGSALEAKMKWPMGLAFDSDGNLYFADNYNHRIRKIDISTGIITTIAGSGLLPTNSTTAEGTGDGGDPLLAKLYFPTDIAIDPANNIYIADTQNFCIRKIFKSSNTILSIAGDGLLGTNVDGQDAKLSRFSSPKGIAVGSDGEIYVSDTYNHTVVKLVP